jgi:hypothetical protein
MAKTRQVRAVDNSAAHTITFGGAKIAEFGRVDPASGWVKFHCSLGNGLEKLFKGMGWNPPGDKTMSEKLEGKLKGGHLILTANGKIQTQKNADGVPQDAEVDIEYIDIKGFECHRFEIEGHKKKGFRRELRFTVTFQCGDGAANLENYMMRYDNARGSLRVSHFPEAIQPELDLSSNEARQATIAETD